MKWPWVRRSTYEAAQASLAFAHAEANRLRAALEIAKDEAWNAMHPLTDRGDGTQGRPARNGGYETVIAVGAVLRGEPLIPAARTVR